VLAAAAPNATLASLAVILTGGSLAGIYPTVLGIAGARYKSHSGTVFGILFAVALAGGMALPWSAGQIGGTLGLRWVFVLLAAAFAAILGLGRTAARVERARATASAEVPRSRASRGI
jgi:fucose permease